MSVWQEGEGRAVGEKLVTPFRFIQKNFDADLSLETDLTPSSWV